MKKIVHGLFIMSLLKQIQLVQLLIIYKAVMYNGNKIKKTANGFICRCG
jgi:hypothetical protein